MSLCLKPNCKSIAAINLRGLCMKHYSEAKKLVANGETTWEELASLGLASIPGDSDMKKELAKRKRIANSNNDDLIINPET